jgi:glutathione peroxidase
MPSLSQTIKKALYPLIMLFTKNTTKGLVLKNEENSKPVQPFHNLTATLNSGKQLSFKELKGKKVLIVNTASNCGFTGQYAELQNLYKQFENKLTIIGFPANDFKEQEKADDDTIAQFCQVNYGVTFPLAKKSVVINSAEQNGVFRWLTKRENNGWLEHEPDWNFSKYLVNENGVLTHYFGPAASPLDAAVVGAINQ